MLCEKCQQNEVTVHLTDIVNNTKKEYHLCRDCAQSHGVSIKATLENFKNLTIPEFYSPPAKGDSESAQDSAPSDCPDCGMSYAKFRKEGKFGCARDYDLFSDSLDELFGKIQPSTQHKGRVPARFHGVVSQSMEVERLRQKMEQAAIDEDYEKAAAIKSQLKSLEQGS
ncbi:MAG: hypothetical protein CBC13_08720 [Planctomycetia bacterium TMED53]|nr:MAG: hypothetical protein CBC13_08720 [Planctomycetia bacterium TMED53]